MNYWLIFIGLAAIALGVSRDSYGMVLLGIAIVVAIGFEMIVIMKKK